MKKVFFGIVFVLLLSLQALGAESTSSRDQHGTLKIISAKYGAGQKWMDVTDVISNMVAEIGFIYIPADPANFSIFGMKDPAPNVRNTLIIKYSYSNEAQGEVHTLIALDGKEVRIPSSPSPTEVGNTKSATTATNPESTPVDTIVTDHPQSDITTNNLYARYKCKYAFIDGEYIRLPDFDLTYENSRRGARLPEAAKWRTWITYGRREVTRRSGGNAVTVIPGDRTNKATVHNDIPYETVYVDEAVPNRERLPQDVIENLERAWKTDLPESMAVGTFGVWPDEKRIAIVHILGPDDLILACNAKRFRLKGVNTAGLQAGNSMLMSTLTVFSYTVTGPKSIRELDITKDKSKTKTGYNTNTGRTAEHETTTEHESRTEQQYVTQDITVANLGPKFSIAVIATRPIPGFSAEPILLAIPTEKVREGLTMEQFAEMLSSGVDLEKQDESAKPLLFVKEADDDPKPAPETQKK